MPLVSFVITLSSFRNGVVMLAKTFFMAFIMPQIMSFMAYFMSLVAV